MPVVGPLLRRGGAFFLRRSFKGEPLYAAVFHEYLHLMIARGFPLEYFIEGGRSRSGRMLAPKAGILGMTIRSFLRGDARPLVFVPVYLGYEKLLEGRAFLDELQGKPKRGESLCGLLGAWRLLSASSAGSHVNFGEPLALAEFLDAPVPAGAASGGCARRLGARRPINEAAERAGAAHQRGGGGDADQPRRPGAAGHAQAHRRRPGAGAPDRALPGAAARGAVLARRGGLRRCRPRRSSPTPSGWAVVERLPHPLGDLLRVRGRPRRPCSPISATTCCTCSPCRRWSPACSGATAASTRAAWTRRWPASTRCCAPSCSCTGPPEALPEAMAAVVAVLTARGLMRRNPETGRYAAPEPNSQAFAELRLLGETIRPTLERHFLTLALLQRQGSGRLTRRALEEAEPPAGAAPGAALRVQRAGILREVAVCRRHRPPHRRRHPARGRGGIAAFRRAHHRARRAGRTGAFRRGAPDHPAHGRRDRSGGTMKSHTAHPRALALRQGLRDGRGRRPVQGLPTRRLNGSVARHVKRVTLRCRRYCRGRWPFHTQGGVMIRTMLKMLAVFLALSFSNAVLFRHRPWRQNRRGARRDDENSGRWHPLQMLRR